MTVIIKPHHLLDVYKLYGRGIFPFSPDSEFEHDFYLIGNLLISRKVDSIVFTTKSDDICKPCKYHENGICTDSLDNDEFINKNDYNNFIDQKLLKYFRLDEDIAYDLNTILSLFIEKASLELFCEVWSSKHIDDNKLRFKNTLEGIKKYMR